MVASKHAFWQALIFALIVFALGLGAGFFFELSRSNDIANLLANSEVEFLDQQLRSSFISGSNVSCGIAINETFRLADKIYHEALLLEEYDSSSKFTEDLQLLHKRYDLLRTLLWLDAINLKSRCSSHPFHTVVYFYNYTSQEVDVRAKQQFYARLLLDLKYNHPSDVLLIPIAIDTGLSSLHAVVETYNISSSPSILIDESTFVGEIPTLDELEHMLIKRHN